MAQPYVGEIRMFAGNFAPAGWMFCDGQLVPIAEYETLFNLIGTTYGGDGESTFALPDLRGRVPLHMGSSFALGQSGGVENVTLTVSQIPSHTHQMFGSTNSAVTQEPADGVFAAAQAQIYFNLADNAQPLAAQSVGPQGASQPHTNLQPFLSVSFIISLFGIFPSPT